MCRLNLTILIFFALLITASSQEYKPANDINQRSIHTGPTFLLKTIPNKINYIPYGAESVKSKNGYGIYFTNAEVDMRLRVIPEADTIIEINYILSEINNIENWFSVRREFTAPLDLREFSGFEFELKVEKASDATFRFAFADDADTSNGRDEIWWYNIKNENSGRSKNWITIRIPFNKFDLSWGNGNRHNNMKIDLEKLLLLNSVLSLEKVNPQ